MIERIVIMTFRAESVTEFLNIFDASAEKIRAFPGNHGLKLIQNTSKPSQLSTYSLWDSEESLNNYRNSELFAGTWVKTKILFSEKPIAFSNKIVRGPY